MSNDEKVRIDATISELMQAVSEGNARRANLAAECASLTARLAEANAELAKLKPAPKLEAVE